MLDLLLKDDNISTGCVGVLHQFVKTFHRSKDPWKLNQAWGEEHSSINFFRPSVYSMKYDLQDPHHQQLPWGRRSSESWLQFYFTMSILSPFAIFSYEGRNEPLSNLIVFSHFEGQKDPTLCHRRRRYQVGVDARFALHFESILLIDLVSYVPWALVVRKWHSERP